VQGRKWSVEKEERAVRTRLPSGPVPQRVLARRSRPGDYDDRGPRVVAATPGPSPAAAREAERSRTMARPTTEEPLTRHDRRMVEAQSRPSRDRRLSDALPGKRRRGRGG
jgi:hypothetical protein